MGPVGPHGSGSLQGLTMTFTEAQHALIRRLQAMPGRPPIVYPNDGTAAPFPRIVVQVSAQAAFGLTLDGIAEATTEIVAQVEVAEGTGAGAADAIVQTIIDQFPLHARFDGLIIQQPPSPRPPLQGGGYFAIPVLIRARHFF